MNSKIKGSQMPFDQDYDDDDVGANDMGSVADPRGGKPTKDQPKTTPPTNADFKKNKNSDAPSTPSKPTSKP